MAEPGFDAGKMDDEGEMMTDSSAPKVFFSYSHDDEVNDDHKEWVLGLCTKLRSDGVDAILDHWDLEPGDPIDLFVGKNLKEAQIVVCICTENYVTKANENLQWVGYEQQIITKKHMENHNFRIIPLIRNNPNKEVPDFFGNRRYIDFDNGSLFDKQYEELLMTLLGESRKTPLGPNPYQTSTVGSSDERPPLGPNPYKTDGAAQVTSSSPSVPQVPLVAPGISVPGADKVGHVVRFGEYDWRVLDVQEGKSLLLADKILETNMPYNERRTEVTWKSCTLRRWLNGKFYMQFPEADRGKISPTLIHNEDNPWYGTDGGEETTDNVFLLSIAEVVQYFGDSGQLANQPPITEFEKKQKWPTESPAMYPKGLSIYIYDQYNKARQAKTLNNGDFGWWWLRSPGDGSDYAAFIDKTGYVNIYGIIVDHANDRGGVRPAFWLDLKS